MSGIVGVFGSHNALRYAAQAVVSKGGTQEKRRAWILGYDQARDRWSGRIPISSLGVEKKCTDLLLPMAALACRGTNADTTEMGSVAFRNSHGYFGWASAASILEFGIHPDGLFRLSQIGSDARAHPAIFASEFAWVVRGMGGRRSCIAIAGHAMVGVNMDSLLFIGRKKLSITPSGPAVREADASAFVLASHSAALERMGAVLMQGVLAREMVVITHRGVEIVPVK